MQRFQDNQTYLYGISERVLVECPKCGKQAEARRSGPRFTCMHCGYTLKGITVGWVGMAKAVVRRKCGWCGSYLARTFRRKGPHPSEVRVPCPQCSHWNYVPVNWHPDSRNLSYDPHFGFRLWLQVRCAGRVLWAYNAEHLAFLRDYVGASIRERTPNTNGSLASRLPTWIKRAANRPAILRAIKRMETRLVT